MKSKMLNMNFKRKFLAERRVTQLRTTRELRMALAVLQKIQVLL